MPKPYCSILPYFSSASYVYQRKVLGLCTGPALWESYINAILGSIPDRSKYLVIMDDLLLYRSKHGHLKYLEELLTAMLKNGLKYHPRSVVLTLYN